VGGVTAFTRAELDPLPDIGGWTTAGADRRNSRLNADASPPQSEIELEWTARSNDPNRPVVAHGLVVVGDRGSLRGIDADSGRVRWRRRLTDTSSLPTTSPVSVGGRICAAAPNGTVVSVRPKDGSIVWEQELDGEFSAPLTAVDGLVYAVSRNGSVHGLDIDDGTVVTTGNIGGQVTVGPAAGHGRLFVTNGGLSAVDMTGTSLWRERPAQYPALSPSVFDDGVVAAVNDGTVRAYEPSGRRLWRAEVYDVQDGMSMFPTAVHEGNPIVAGHGNGANPPALAAINGDNGAVKWRVELNDIGTGPVIGGGLVWIVTGETLGGFDPETGERTVSMQIPTNAGSRFNLVPVGDRIFSVDEDAVYSLR
ncbi:MAG: PQQ-binding-like beta-propeller repeat protein, partial [Natronomonas sp.]